MCPALLSLIFKNIFMCITIVLSSALVLFTILLFGFLFSYMYVFVGCEPLNKYLNLAFTFYISIPGVKRGLLYTPTFYVCKQITWIPHHPFSFMVYKPLHGGVGVYTVTSSQFVLELYRTLGHNPTDLQLNIGNKSVHMDYTSSTCH